jgi:hypothetical protein
VALGMGSVMLGDCGDTGRGESVMLGDCGDTGRGEFSVV